MSSSLLRRGVALLRRRHPFGSRLVRSPARPVFFGKSIAPQSTWSSAAQNLLDDHNLETRDGLKSLFKGDIFRPRYDISLAQDRELAYARLQEVCGAGLISVKDFWTNPRNIFAAHEVSSIQVLYCLKNLNANKLLF